MSRELSSIWPTANTNRGKGSGYMYNETDDVEIIMGENKHLNVAMESA